MRRQSSAWRLFSSAVLLCTCGAMALAQTTTETYTYSYSGNPLPIFRNDANIVTLAYIPVQRSSQIQSVKATVDIEYANIGDLNLFLYSPAGTRTKLLERNCGGSATLRITTFDDSAPSKYSDVCPSQPGTTMRANEPLSNSRGENGAGVWSLAVENNGSNDFIGWLQNWSVTITGQVYSSPTTASGLVVDSASLIGQGVAPGELISVFGTNLGPSKPVEATTPDLPTTLGGTQVTFNEQVVPIKYSSKYRVDVQAPYNLGQGGDVWITVQYGGGSSAPVSLPVWSTKPGLLAVNPSGLGQLQAVNENGSLNKNEAAPRGSVITVCASGLGYTWPVVEAGKAPPAKPPAAVWYPVTASIGGIQAVVNEAILVADRPGVYSVKIVVPKELSPGVAAVKIANVASASQDGVFIRIR